MCWYSHIWDDSSVLVINKYQVQKTWQIRKIWSKLSLQRIKPYSFWISFGKVIMQGEWVPSEYEESMGSWRRKGNFKVVWRNNSRLYCSLIHSHVTDCPFLLYQSELSTNSVLGALQSTGDVMFSDKNAFCLLRHSQSSWTDR